MAATTSPRGSTKQAYDAVPRPASPMHGTYAFPLAFPAHQHLRPSVGEKHLPPSQYTHYPSHRSFCSGTSKRQPVGSLSLYRNLHHIGPSARVVHRLLSYPPIDTVLTKRPKLGHPQCPRDDLPGAGAASWTKRRLIVALLHCTNAHRYLAVHGWPAECWPCARFAGSATDRMHIGSLMPRHLT